MIEKDLQHNTLIVGGLAELGRDHLTAGRVNWVSGAAPVEPFRAQIKIRYKAQEAWGWVEPFANDQFQVKFDHPLRDITPGQAAVIYNGDICLGGGIIES